MVQQISGLDLFLTLTNAGTAPRVGFSASEYRRDYRVGYSLGVLDAQSPRFEVDVDAQRRENPILGGADNGVLSRASLGW